MKIKIGDVWKEVELGLGGGSRFRVVKHLILNSNEAFTKYALVKATGLKTRIVEGQLRVLLNLGWIEEYPFTPATYEINLKNHVVKHFHELFHKLRYARRAP